MQSLQENVHTLTQVMTKEFLIMGQIMNQGVSRNPLHCHPPPPITNHQILVLQLPHPSVAKVNPRGILIWGNHQTSLRGAVKIVVPFCKWERKQHTIHFNLKTLKNIVHFLQYMDVSKQHFQTQPWEVSC